jgi:hypothetical protein
MSSSDGTVIISIGGLVECEEADLEVSVLWAGTGTMSTSESSTLALTSSVATSVTVSVVGGWAAGEGDGGEEDDESLWGAFLRLIVTMLEGGSVGGSRIEVPGSGVFGATGSDRASTAESRLGTTGSVSSVVELEESWSGFTVSREFVGDPERDVRRRLRDEISPSSKGFGRVELASAEAARSGRSRDIVDGSIGIV